LHQEQSLGGYLAGLRGRSFVDGQIVVVDVGTWAILLGKTVNIVSK